MFFEPCTPLAGGKHHSCCAPPKKQHMRLGRRAMSSAMRLSGEPKSAQPLGRHPPCKDCPRVGPMKATMTTILFAPHFGSHKYRQGGPSVWGGTSGGPWRASFLLGVAVPFEEQSNSSGKSGQPFASGTRAADAFSAPASQTLGFPLRELTPPSTRRWSVVGELDYFLRRHLVVGGGRNPPGYEAI